MTDITDLCRKLDAAKAGEDISLSFSEISIVAKIAMMGASASDLSGLSELTAAIERIKTPHTEPQQPVNALITIDEVCDDLRISRTTLWKRRRDDPTFPKPLRRSAQMIAWDREEYQAWKTAQRA